MIKHYKYFVIPKYRLCRQGITFVLYGHGLIYFSCSYGVELIKNEYISRDLMTTISNVAIIPVFLVTSFLRKIWSDQ